MNLKLGKMQLLGLAIVAFVAFGMVISVGPALALETGTVEDTEPTGTLEPGGVAALEEPSVEDVAETEVPSLETETEGPVTPEQFLAWMLRYLTQLSESEKEALAGAVQAKWNEGMGGWILQSEYRVAVANQLALQIRDQLQAGDSIEGAVDEVMALWAEPPQNLGELVRQRQKHELKEELKEQAREQLQERLREKKEDRRQNRGQDQDYDRNQDRDRDQDGSFDESGDNDSSDDNPGTAEDTPASSKKKKK